MSSPSAFLVLMATTTLPPDWVDKTTKDPGYCYLVFYEKKHRQPVAYTLGAYPTWSSIKRMGHFRPHGQYSARKLPGSPFFHVYLSSGPGVSPHDLDLKDDDRIGHNPSWGEVPAIAVVCLLAVVGWPKWLVLGAIVAVTHFYWHRDRSYTATPQRQGVDPDMMKILAKAGSARKTPPNRPGKQVLKEQKEEKDFKEAPTPAQKKKKKKKRCRSGVSRIAVHTLLAALGLPLAAATGPPSSILHRFFDQPPKFLVEAHEEAMKSWDPLLPADTVCIGDRKARLALLTVLGITELETLAYDYAVTICPAVRQIEPTDTWYQDLFAKDPGEVKEPPDKPPDAPASAEEKEAPVSLGSAVDEVLSEGWKLGGSLWTLATKIAKHAAESDDTVLDLIGKATEESAKFAVEEVTETWSARTVLTEARRLVLKVPTQALDWINATYSDLTGLGKELTATAIIVADELGKDSYSVYSVTRNTTKFIVKATLARAIEATKVMVGVGARTGQIANTTVVTMLEALPDVLDYTLGWTGRYLDDAANEVPRPADLVDISKYLAFEATGDFLHWIAKGAALIPNVSQAAVDTVRPWMEIAEGPVSNFPDWTGRMVKAFTGDWLTPWKILMSPEQRGPGFFDGLLGWLYTPRQLSITLFDSGFSSGDVLVMATTFILICLISTMFNPLQLFLHNRLNRDAG